MNCSYKLTETETVKAMKLHGKGSRKTIVVLVIAFIGLILFGVFSKYTLLGFCAALGGVVGYFTVQLLVTPINAKRQFRQNRALRVEISMSLTDNGITFKSESGESKLHWNDIHKWRYQNGIYLLYITSNMFHMVPDRALPSDIEFGSLLNNKIGPKKA